MRVLAIDPGAKRAGWAVLETGPKYLRSDLVEFPRTNEFQKYRMELVEFWTEKGTWLLNRYGPDIMVTETVPAVGANNMSQMYLANVMVSTIHTLATMQGVAVRQVSARSVQAKIALRGRGAKITKVQVRKGVIERLPELAFRAKDWIKVFEESDALAIGLYGLDEYS